MTNDAAPRRAGFRPWRDLRWITGGVVALGVGWLAWNLFGPEPSIVVSRATTYLIEPLAADGLPDYQAAMLALCGPPALPEENAAALLMETCWPLGVDGRDQAAVCKALGIPNEPPVDPLREPTRDAGAGIDREIYEQAHERPWTSAELPAMAAWLEKKSAAIDRVVEAAGRPRYWLPSPTLLGTERQMLISMLLPDIQELRQLGRVLLCRAMWRLGEGRPADAWRDIRATYRLGRLLSASNRGQGILVTELVAIAIESTADRAVTRHLLTSLDLSAAVIADVARDLADVGLPPHAAVMSAMERLTAIDGIVWIARRQPGGRGARIEMFNAYGMVQSPLAGAALLTSLDWNIVLQRMNEAADRLDAACRLAKASDRRKEIERQEEECRRRATAAYRTWWTTAGHVVSMVCNRGHRSEAVGDTFIALLMPALSSVDDTFARRRASFELTQTAVALAAWHADRAADAPPYPDRLDELVPRYLAAVPVDPFSDKPFVYERREDGYLLASVGQNGVYDGGDDLSGDIVDGEWQTPSRGADFHNSDIVVRMPGPAKQVQP